MVNMAAEDDSIVIGEYDLSTSDNFEAFLDELGENLLIVLIINN